MGCGEPVPEGGGRALLARTCCGAAEQLPDSYGGIQQFFSLHPMGWFGLGVMSLFIVAVLLLCTTWYHTVSMPPVLFLSACFAS